MRRKITIMATICGAVLMIPLQGRPALDQCGTLGHYFAGYTQHPRDVNEYEGASAQITARPGLVCESNSNGVVNDSSAWSMIAGGFLGVPGYSQSGYLRRYGGSIYHFVEFNRTGSSTCYSGCSNWGFYFHLFTEDGALSSGSKTTYQQNWNTGCACIQNRIGGVVRASTNFNPFSYWARPFSPQWFGEVKYRESDIPGTSPARADFANLRVQRFSDDQFTATLPLLLQGNDNGPPPAGRWWVTGVGSNTFQIYCDVQCT